MVKSGKIDDAIPGAEYPRLFRAVGACPPEDVGGVPCCAEVLDATADARHVEHDRIPEMSGGQCDPDEAEIARVLDNVDDLANKMGPSATQLKRRSETDLMGRTQYRPSTDACLSTEQSAGTFAACWPVPKFAGYHAS